MLKSLRKKVSLLLGACMCVSLFTVVSPISDVAATVSINNDTVNKIVTMSGARYTLTLNYNSKAVITSFRQDGTELLGSQGIYSAVNNNGTWVTTQGLSSSPSVSVNGNIVTATLSTTVASESWTFTVNDANIVYKLNRTYSGSYTVTMQGTPILHFAQNAVENIRWAQDGGNWPIAGDAAGAGNWLSTSASNNTNSRSAKEQISYTLLNGNTSIALKVDGTSAFSSTERGEATIGERLPDGQLRLYTNVKSGGLSYWNGNTKGYGNYSYSPAHFGHQSLNCDYLYSSFAVSNGNNVWTQLTFTPDTYSSYYDLGTMNGISETALGKWINDYGRWIMSDKKHAGYTEGTNWRFELVPSEMHWLTQQIDTFQYNKSASINAFKEGLKDVRDTNQTAAGHVLVGGLYANPDTSWGRNNSDNETGYVLAVSNLYDLSGDTTWLQSFKTSCEMAMDYELSTYCNPTTKLVKVDYSAHNPSTHSNEYFEIAWWNGQNSNSCIGQPNGVTSAMLYDALRRFAVLEQNVLNDSAKASYYNGIADTIKTNFNKNKASGGCWLSSINTIMLSTTTAETSFLPAIGAALKSDLISLENRQAMSQRYINELKNSGSIMMVNNVYDLANANVLSDYTHQGCDGGMYGGAAGDGYATFVAANDRESALYYTNQWLGLSMSNIFSSSVTDFHRDGSMEGVEGNYPANASVAWGLYHYIYGFQPSYNTLTIAPFIANSMVNSTVKYNFRDVGLQVQYLGINKFKVTIPTMPANTNYIIVKWLNQTPNNSGYNIYYTEGGYNTSKTADADGSIAFGIGAAGTYTLELTNPDKSFVTGTALTTTRNNSNVSVGMKITTGSTPITVKQLGRYYISGNSGTHTLSINRFSDNALIASATVDMLEGSYDALRFKYAILSSPVTLAANTSYVISSTETYGGDSWYDADTTISHTSAAAVNHGTYYSGGWVQAYDADHCYVPLNFIYN